MTDNIQNLAQVASHLAIDEIAYLERIHNRKYDTEECKNVFNEKFAELIARECAELCLVHEISDEPFGTKSYRKGSQFHTIIKNHFGVE